MSLRLFLPLIGLLEALKIGLAQSDMVPDPLWEIIKDFPLLAIFGGAIYLILKWLVRMLEDQRIGLRDIYEGHSQFVKTLLEQAQKKQDKLEMKVESSQESIDELKAEIQLLRGTVSETANMHDIVDRLLEEVRNK